MARTVRSPDGRTWTLERVSPESSLGATMKEPFFWPSAIATIVILALAVRLLMVDTGWITFIILVPLLLIWFLERGLSFARPNIRAHTDGPPAETHTWRTTHRIGLGRIENRIAEQIEQGHLEAEPAGAVLIGI
ncbi:MAG TPA: hypothetical protein VFB87_00375 [Gaiellaceae bacterium]|jgi:hypothetical protein|nr:hypothetical protein [Gaiellaceae bacterium]